MGIQVEQREFKTCLFADNVIIYLTDPKQSLPAVEDILATFQETLGLAINKSKSEIYPIFLHPDDAHNLQQLTSYKWIKSSWK